jgi:GDP-L-fucose synthase
VNWWSDKTVLVTGGMGFLGRHMRNHLLELGASRVAAARRADYDLTDTRAAEALVARVQPHVLVHLAARCGGIKANADAGPAMFRDNMRMGINTMDAAALNGVEVFTYVGTVCSYPGLARVPFEEDALWLGLPDPSNAPYGVAKRALITYAVGLAARRAFKLAVVLPANLYGPGDNFDPDTSHVIPALVRKFVEAAGAGAAMVTLWGSGRATRDFLHVRDAARGIAMAARRAWDCHEATPINLGTGREVSVRELAGMVANAAGYDGVVEFDPARPEGQARRCLSTVRAKQLLGFRAQIRLEDGIHELVDWWRASAGSGQPGP